MDTRPVSRESALDHLEKVLSSAAFQGAGRSSTLLKFLVNQALDGQTDRLKEFTIGAEALGKGDSFDPRTDPIVRAEASRLRNRLERYYLGEGQIDRVVISLPKGSYAPQFDERASAPTGDAAPAPGSAPAGVAWRGRLIWFALGAAAASVVMFVFWPSRSTAPAEDVPLRQFDVELRSRGSLGSEVGIDVILSPDGARLVYVSRDDDGQSRLNTRRLDQESISELPGTEGARSPFFSPDGRWVGFWAAGKLKKTAVAGGSPVILCDAADILGAAWGEDGNIVAALSRGRLSRLPASGGAPVTLLDTTAQSIAPQWPQIPVGGKHVVFTAIGPLGPNAATVEALTLSGGARQILVRGGTYGRILPNGYLTYVNQGTLFAQRVDLDRLASHGAPVPVLDHVAYSSAFGFAQVDFSRTGALVYRRDAGAQLIAAWLDRSGAIEPLLSKPGPYVSPRMSPDGTRLALTTIESGAMSVWIHEPRLNRTMRLAVAGDNGYPVWTPDGRFLVLGGPSGLAFLRADSADRPQPLLQARIAQIPWSFTPDGTRLAYHQLSSATGFDLWTVPIQTTSTGLIAGTPTPYLATPSFEVYPSFSPDGRWLAYGSNESGSWEVYVRAFPDNGTKVQISAGGGRIPRWAPDGRDLYYRTDDQRLMVTSYTVRDGSFAAATPKEWTHGPLGDTGVLSNFDLEPDGHRVVALVSTVSPADQQSPNHVTFTLNFFDEVHRRVAQGAK